MNWKIAVGVGGVVVTAFAFACSDDHDHDEGGAHTSAFPSCQTIIDACHPLDVGDGPIHDCHEVGHGTGATEANCAAKKTECLATCKKPDAG